NERFKAVRSRGSGPRTLRRTLQWRWRTGFPRRAPNCPGSLDQASEPEISGPPREARSAPPGCRSKASALLPTDSDVTLIETWPGRIGARKRSPAAWRAPDGLQAGVPNAPPPKPQPARASRRRDARITASTRGSRSYALQYDRAARLSPAHPDNRSIPV